MFELVRTSTKDKLYLHGLLFSGDKTKPALLHIHGFEGNFYENYFVEVIAKAMQKKNLAFLTANTRGNGKDTDFNTTDGKTKRIGAHFELIDDTYLDIDAWIEFLLKQGYKSIILQGHSLGTIKAVRYLFEGKYKDKIKKLILLSPFDGRALIESITDGNIDKLVRKAEQKVKEGKGDEMTTREYDNIETSYKTYVSWYRRDDFGRMFEFCNKDYKFPLLRKIKVPTKIVVGTKDEYFYPSNPQHPEEAMKTLLKNIPNSEGKLIENAHHTYISFEDKVASEILNFVAK
jgi:pimeloyl-ACP methyl ester carboxylesterase